MSPISGRPLTSISTICSGLHNVFAPCILKVIWWVPLVRSYVSNWETPSDPSAKRVPSILETHEYLSISWLDVVSPLNETKSPLFMLTPQPHACASSLTRKYDICEFGLCITTSKKVSESDDVPLLSITESWIVCVPTSKSSTG